MAGRTDKRAPKLNAESRAYIVQRLACYESPSDLVKEIREKFKIEITSQGVERYDPTKLAGKRCAKKWKVLFAATREAFNKHIADYVPEANKAVRVKKLAKASQTFEKRNNLIGMANMFERIAKELGGSFTNQRQLTGKGGGPIEHKFTELTDDEIDTRLAALLAKADDGRAADA